MKHGLGRIFRDDARNWPLRAAIPAGAELQNRSWSLPRSKFLDQGQTPACTGFSAAHDLEASPAVVTGINNAYAQKIYREAQKDDEWPGENYEGSSVLGATRALSVLGFKGEYRWAGKDGSDIADDVALALANIGPVVFGTDWLEGMFDFKNGTVDVSGQVAGGHAYLASFIAVTKTAKASRLQGGTVRDEPLIGGPNSWGLSWGLKGMWVMWLSDARRLLQGVESPGEGRVSTVPFRRA